MGAEILNFFSLLKGFPGTEEDVANRGGIVVMPPRKTKANPRLDCEKRIKQLKIAILRIHVGKFICIIQLKIQPNL